MSCYGEQKTNVVAWAIAHKKVTSKRVANKACGMAERRRPRKLWSGRFYPKAPPSVMISQPVCSW